MGAMDKLKTFLGFGEELDEEEDMYEPVSTTAPVAPVETREEAPSSYDRNRTKPQAKPPISLHNSSAQMRICIHEPLSYDESPLIVDDLRLRKAVILNFEQLDMSVKRQIFDFVNGALYSLDGKIQKVNKDIFILAPSNVEIDGLREELKNKGVFPW